MSPTGGREGGRSQSFTDDHRKVIDLSQFHERQAEQSTKLCAKPKSVHSILHVGAGHDSVALQRHWHLQHTINLRPSANWRPKLRVRVILRTSPDWMPMRHNQLFFSLATRKRMKLLEETKESFGYRGVFFSEASVFFLMREEANSDIREVS